MTQDSFNPQLIETQLFLLAQILYLEEFIFHTLGPDQLQVVKTRAKIRVPKIKDNLDIERLDEFSTS